MAFNCFKDWKYSNLLKFKSKGFHVEEVKKRAKVEGSRISIHRLDIPFSEASLLFNSPCISFRAFFFEEWTIPKQNYLEIDLIDQNNTQWGFYSLKQHIVFITFQLMEI